MKQKINLKMNDDESLWAGLAYVFPFTIFVYLFNKNNMVLKLHSIRSFYLYIPSIFFITILFLIRSNKFILSNSILLNLSIIYFILLCIWCIFFIIELINCFLDTCKGIYKTKLIDNIFHFSNRIIKTKK